MTAHAATDDAAAVMREGARDYIQKPFELDELVLRVERVRQELEVLRRMEAGGGGDGTKQPIRGVSSAARRLIEAAAASDAPLPVSWTCNTTRGPRRSAMPRSSRGAAFRS
jgi:DNA-binding NtrC family response regulator